MSLASAARRPRFLIFLAVTVALLAASIGPLTQFANAATLDCGPAKGAFVFVRNAGANGLGHVGWGYRLTCEGAYAYGSVENPTGKAHIDKGFDNGFWTGTGTETQMLADMRTHGYNSYKSITTAKATFDTDPADVAAAASGGRGYDVIGNNCADNVWDVLHAYGVPDLPYLQLLPAPNMWYAALGRTSNVEWAKSATL
ncbi:hypothetical protein [Actinoplanes sp. NPDC026670]|uniref:hypothetical protein n=1 Tax=Actinoplanes sp. NPDC026670 TaxID=3154700 RepID=UPI0033FD466E